MSVTKQINKCDILIKRGGELRYIQADYIQPSQRLVENSWSQVRITRLGRGHRAQLPSRIKGCYKRGKIKVTAALGQVTCHQSRHRLIFDMRKMISACYTITDEWINEIKCFPNFQLLGIAKSKIWKKANFLMTRLAFSAGAKGKQKETELVDPVSV